MYQIFLDCSSESILVPKKVTEAVGAVEDFGIWVRASGTSILINSEVPALWEQKTGKPGRPHKQSSNMDHWNDKENAYRVSLKKLWAFSRYIPGFKHGSSERYVIVGKSSDDGIVFDFKKAVKSETLDLTGYSIIPLQMLRKLRREETQCWK
jgi:hypothetical protein